MKFFTTASLFVLSLSVAYAHPAQSIASTTTATSQTSKTATSTATTSSPSSSPAKCTSSNIGVNPFLPHSAPVSWCADLTNNCLEEALTTTYIWHKTSCVAAATCNGPNLVYNLTKCVNNEIADTRAGTPDLSTNIWSGITDGCGTTCDMTQQNYIDFFYGALSAINETTWPTSADVVINNQWSQFNDWTNTGATIPYGNFDDFLHYAVLDF